MNNEIIPAHGGVLAPLLIDGDAGPAEIRRAATLFRLPVDSMRASDLVMFAIGAFSPLQGFMTSEDYHSVLQDMRLRSGLVWPIPITMAVGREQAQAIREGDEIALADALSGTTLATMAVTEKYVADKRAEAECVFGTSDSAHPGVSKLYAQGDVYLAGTVKALSEGGYPDRFPEYARPRETRRAFAERGWRTVAAFQTRNPMHRSHEYLVKIALEVCDGVLIHPIVGDLKPGDIPAEVRMACYRALLNSYFPKDRALLRVYPMEMRYAGPREALLHAIIRQNYGCTHMIIGRDHAGVGGYYGPFDAQAIFDTLGPEELRIQPLKLDVTFWCRKCDAMASSKTCPHSEEDRITISGTRLRELLTAGEPLPAQFSRPEVVDILRKYYAGGIQ